MLDRTMEESGTWDGKRHMYLYGQHVTDFLLQILACLPMSNIL